MFYKYVCPDVGCEKQLCNKGIERGPQHHSNIISDLLKTPLILALNNYNYFKNGTVNFFLIIEFW